MIEYEVLHYPGDLRGHPELLPGCLLGTNEVGHPWEVLDVEVRMVPFFEGARGMRQQTTVHLQTASREAVLAAFARSELVGRAAYPGRGGEPRHVRRQRLRAEGRL